MAASSSWFRRKQTSLASTAVTVHLEDCLLRAAVTVALGPDGLTRGCKFVGLAQWVWFFFLFIIFGFEWLEVRHALLFTVSLTMSMWLIRLYYLLGPLPWQKKPQKQTDIEAELTSFKKGKYRGKHHPRTSVFSIITSRMVETSIEGIGRSWEDVTTAWTASWTRASRSSSPPPLSLECTFCPLFLQEEPFSRSQPWENKVLGPSGLNTWLSPGKVSI